MFSLLCSFRTPLMPVADMLRLDTRLDADFVFKFVHNNLHGRFVNNAVELLQSAVHGLDLPLPQSKRLAFPSATNPQFSLFRVHGAHPFDQNPPKNSNA